MRLFEKWLVAIAILALVVITHDAIISFYWPEEDIKKNPVLWEELLPKAEKDGLFDKYRKVTCEVVWFKDGATLKIKDCFRSVGYLMHPSAQWFFSLIGINFQTIQIHKSVYEQTELRDYIINMIKNREYAETNEPLLIMVVVAGDYHLGFDKKKFKLFYMK